MADAEFWARIEATQQRYEQRTAQRRKGMGRSRSAGSCTPTRQSA